MKLLLGLLEPTEGKIKIDGVALSQFGIARWRKQVGAVMQNDQLFSGNLMDNIAAFDVQIDMEQLNHFVNQSIESLSISRITIAHRPETIAMASRIISLIATSVAPSGSCYSSPRMPAIGA